MDAAIEEALADADPVVMVRLVEALAQIPGRAARHRLHALAANPDRQVALAARFALGHDEQPDR